ncbi:fungal zn(2)-Cys(6) binuclear cluster domain-containing protein [Sarocladium implicatum]|nr:fungal zn(2)-Cys(6) binuclear cluster domain-containing protein [Sarocladium implicatum]
MTTADALPSIGPVHRVSLACLPCRSRHLKCNATKPVCSRCAADSVQCTYARSRRGGRRTRAKPTETASAQDPRLNLDQPLLPTPESSSTGSSAAHLSPGRLSGSTAQTLESNTTSGVLGLNVLDTDLIGDYYKYFHPAHPCVLPRWALEKHCAQHPHDFTPILQVMQYIGSFFNDLADSDAHHSLAKAALPLHRSEYSTPYEVQAMLLYAIATYWSDNVEYGLELTDAIIPSALALQMHHDSYATQYGQGDALLEESWRRTWWLLYHTHASMSATAHALPTQLSGLQMTVRLPSEEDRYEAGDIPEPRTLAEYDMREFLPADDPGFSSYAQVIGVLRAIDLVITEHAPINENRAEICAQIDVGISAWQSLLPPAKRRLLLDGQGLDIHLFAAQMTITVYVVDFHRSLSDLSYSSIESVARCTPPAPPLRIRPGEAQDTQFHTSKALVAIRRLGDLLPLPPSLHTITPFFICVIATITIAHLSACRYLFRDKVLQLERERVRLNMGALRMLGEHWPLGKRTYDEMGIIAREILCLSDKDCSAAQEELQSSLKDLSPLPMDLFLDNDFSLFDL